MLFSFFVATTMAAPLINDIEMCSAALTETNLLERNGFQIEGVEKSKLSLDAVDYWSFEFKADKEYFIVGCADNRVANLDLYLFKGLDLVATEFQLSVNPANVFLLSESTDILTLAVHIESGYRKHGKYRLFVMSRDSS